MVVAIDGPAGAGKSTIARYVASQMGFVYVNSGNLYRAITWEAITHSCIDDIEEIVLLAKTLNLNIDGDRVLNGSEDLSPHLRSDQVESYISLIAKSPELRKVVNDILRNSCS